MVEITRYDNDDYSNTYNVDTEFGEFTMICSPTGNCQINSIGEARVFDDADIDADIDEVFEAINKSRIIKKNMWLLDLKISEYDKPEDTLKALERYIVEIKGEMPYTSTNDSHMVLILVQMNYNGMENKYVKKGRDKEILQFKNYG